MKIAGIPIPKSLIAATIESAVKSAAEIGYPVVMKVVSRDILHKSDAGGVALDLENKKEVIDAYEAILRNCRATRSRGGDRRRGNFRNGPAGHGDDRRRPAWMRPSAPSSCSAWAASTWRS